MNVQATFATTLVDEWWRCGLTDAVVSPGSRSTPLALALAGDGRVRVHMVLDERSAGFRAVGLSLASSRPTVVLTTSGTAAVGLHPAVVEAHHARVPVVVCTADRPPELHHVGAPQTVEQARLFGEALRWGFEPGVPDEAAAGAWRSMAARAVAEATGGPGGPGPVHLNLAFREPLTGEPGPLPPPRGDGGPWHRRPVRGPAPPPEVVQELASSAARGVILAGAGAGDPEAVHDLAAALGWPVLADPRSACRLPGPATVAAADALLRTDAFAAAHRPDVVLRLGALWASRVVAEWLAGLDAAQYLVDPYGVWLDPGRSATTVVAADPTLLCRDVARAGAHPVSPAWAQGWRIAEALAQDAFDSTLARHPEPTEPAVARAVVAALPDGAALVTSSSMPVRDVEWYGRPRRSVRFFANRGANGIDGVVSTAVGVATAWPGPTAALVGDLAFLHDANGLLGSEFASGRGPTLVVVDNDGGGIFSFLPQAGVLDPGRFEQLLGTPHGLDLCQVARAHGAPAYEAKTVDDVAEAVAGGDRGGGVGTRVVVVRTDRAANVGVHDEIHEAVATALTDPTPAGRRLPS